MSSYIILGGEEKKWNSFLTPFEKYVVNTTSSPSSSTIISFQELTSGASSCDPLISVLFGQQSIKIIKIDDGKNTVCFIWKPVLNAELFTKMLSEDDSERSEAKTKVCKILENFRIEIIESVLHLKRTDNTKIHNFNSEAGWMLLQSRKSISQMLKEKVIPVLKKCANDNILIFADESDATKSRMMEQTSSSILIKSDASCVIDGSHSMMHIENEQIFDDCSETLASFKNAAPKPWILQSTFVPKNKNHHENQNVQQQRQFMLKIFCLGDKKVFYSIYHNKLSTALCKSDIVGKEEGEGIVSSWTRSKTFFEKCSKIEDNSHQPFFEVGTKEEHSPQKLQSFCPECQTVLKNVDLTLTVIPQLCTTISRVCGIELFGVDVVVTMLSSASSDDDERELLLINIVDVNAFPDYSGVKPVEKIFEALLMPVSV